MGSLKQPPVEAILEQAFQRTYLLAGTQQGVSAVKTFAGAIDSLGYAVVPKPDVAMEEALRRCSDRVRDLLIENQKYRDALGRINNMDYRGNRSMEQDIAAAALVFPDKINPDGR